MDTYFSGKRGLVERTKNVLMTGVERSRRTSKRETPVLGLEIFVQGPLRVIPVLGLENKLQNICQRLETKNIG